MIKTAKKKTKNKITPKMVLAFIATALLAGGITFGLGFLLQTVISRVASGWVEMSQIATIITFMVIVIKSRPGKEVLSLELGAKALGISLFFMGLDKLPFNIPYFNYAVSTTNIVSFLTNMATVYLSETVIFKLFKIKSK